MMNLRYVSCFLCVALLSFACSKEAPTGGSSSVSIQMPKSFGNGALAGYACFAVSITGDNIPAVGGGECDPSFGDFAGLAGPGATLTLETSRGSNRTVDIYYIISEQPCTPGFNASGGLGQAFGSDKVYRIGRTAGVNFEKSQETVEVRLEYPSNKNKLKTLLAAEKGPVPASCLKDDGATLAGANDVRHVMGSFRGLTDAGNKVHVRAVQNKIEVKIPDFSSGKISPIQLGESQ